MEYIVVFENKKKCIVFQKIFIYKKNKIADSGLVNCQELWLFWIISSISTNTIHGWFGMKFLFLPIVKPFAIYDIWQEIK